MATPKAQTLQQHFGFQDKDLTTPKHDEIMMWLIDNIEKILYSPSWQDRLKRLWEIKFEEVCSFIKHSGGENIYQQIYPQLIQQAPKPDTIAIEKISRQWEYPIVDKNAKSNTRYVIGFIDLHVSFKIKEPSASYGNTGNSIKDWDYGTCLKDILINFEVKTNIPSLGELLRQINLYKTYNNNKFVVVSPDDRFQSQLQSQGVGFLKYEPEKYK